MTHYFSKQPDWTKEQVNEVAAYLVAGWTSAEIGMRMNILPDAVQRRVAAISQLNAIGFDRRAINQRNVQARSEKISDIAIRKTPTIKALHDAFDKASRQLPLRDVGVLECVWPVNEPPRGGTYLFCGRLRANGSRYCEHHRNRAKPALCCEVVEAA